MKKYGKTALVLVLALCILALAGCGPKSVEDIEGVILECKQFSAKCPEGWTNIPVMELDNPDAVSGNHLRFYKFEVDEGEDPATSDKRFSKTYIDIGKYPSSATLYDDSMSMYNNIQDVELEVNGVKWKGKSGDLAGHTYAYIWKEGSTEWQVNVCLSEDEGDKLDDMDIQAILASLTAK